MNREAMLAALRARAEDTSLTEPERKAARTCIRMIEELDISIEEIRVLADALPAALGKEHFS